MEFHIEFIHRYRHHMVIAFGSSCAASDRFYLGDLQQQLDRFFADLVRLLERTAGSTGERDRRAAFIEGWQKFLAHAGVKHRGGEKQCEHDADHGEGRIERGLEEGFLGEIFQRADQRAIMVDRALRRLEHERAKYWDQRQRNDE